MSLLFAFFRDVVISCEEYLSLQVFFLKVLHPTECKHRKFIKDVSTVMDTELNLTAQLICVSPERQYGSIRRKGVG